MTQEAIHLSNNPPLVDPEEIAARHKAAFIAATEVLRSAEDWPAEVNGPADVETLTAGVRAARAARKTLDDARSSEKRRFDDAGREVQNLFIPRIGKLDVAKTAAEATLTRHNRKVEEAERQKAAEAAAREREEADRRHASAARLEDAGHADVAATVMDTAIQSQQMAEKLEHTATSASAADLVRTHTAAGTVTSATTMAFEVVDSAALRGTLGILGDFLDQPSIDKAIRAYMKAAKLASRAPAINGVRFFADSRARVR